MRIGIFFILIGAAVICASADETSYSGFLHAMHESMAQMRQAMDRPTGTGDPDRDFAFMMIPHHQGAIEMAKIELLYGKDPVMRRLAQEIIADQQSEIDAIQLRLAKNSGKTKREK
jgi:uncharacterized protein (DUF305 family)